MVNREPSYLRDQALSFVANHPRKDDLFSLYDDEWLGYTDRLIKKTTEKKATPARRRKKRQQPKKRASAPPSYRKQAAPTGKRDIFFAWPLDKTSFWISSFFGPRKKPNGAWGFHHGIDLAALRGTPVKAAASGVVVEARYASGYGKTIVIAHSKKYKTRYAHLDKILVTVGKKVERGQLIGKVGATGFVRKEGKDASHLHFEVYAFGKKVNPLYLLA